MGRLSLHATSTRPTPKTTTSWRLHPRGDAWQSPLNVALAGMPRGPGHHDALERALAHEAAVWAAVTTRRNATTASSSTGPSSTRSGSPVSVSHHRLAENSKRLGRAGIARAREYMSACGATENPGCRARHPCSAWHLLGTALMGNDPSSPSSTAGKSTHDVPNLFAVDGSSFPTAGAVNPTNTIRPSRSARPISILGDAPRLERRPSQDPAVPPIGQLSSRQAESRNPLVSGRSDKALVKLVALVDTEAFAEPIGER